MNERARDINGSRDGLEKNTARPNTTRDLESLIAATEKNRIQLQKAREKFETLEAAIESAKKLPKRTKSGPSSDQPKL